MEKAADSKACSPATFSHINPLNISDSSPVFTVSGVGGSCHP